MSVIEFEPEHLERYELPRLPFAGEQIGWAPTLDSVKAAVAKDFGLRPSDLQGDDRHQSVALARHIAIYLCREHTGASYPELGRAFGNRDHTTAMDACRKIAQLATTDARFAARLERLQGKFR